MNTFISRVALLAAIVAAPAVPALSNPIQFGSDYFEYVSSPLSSWKNAETAAASMSYLGASGYLAVITSSAEDAFLTSNFTISTKAFEGAWLGGRCFGSGKSAACFWADGPQAGEQYSRYQTSVGGAYVNWGGIEPNNAPSAMYLNVGASYADIANGQWADAEHGLASRRSDPVRGYIVEFAATPLPAAFPLFASGLGAIGLLGWRKKRKNILTAA